MIYILGYRPYEFGLVPDFEGFVAFKELIRVITEEPGWGYVRQGSVNEVLLGENRNLFQIEGQKIRAIERRWVLDFKHPALFPPKILFIGIRRKAHPVVMEKGLRPITGGRYHVLSPERETAQRLGKRLDQQPVLLEVMAELAQQEGALFYPFGELFLSPEILVRHIAGPPVPKHVMKAGEEKAQKTAKTVPDFQAGSFILNIDRDMDKSRKTGGRKKKGWKEEVRKRKRKGERYPF